MNKARRLRMADSPHITFRAIEVEQPIGRFYVGAIDSEDLHEICFFDIRHLESRELDRYLGVQRALSDRRVDEIRKYLGTVDATFPTSVIIALSARDAVFNPEVGAMAVRRAKDVAKIIDGQHRIAGLERRPDKRFMVNVTIFIDMDIEDQANVFATINVTQTRVRRSLVFDLLEYQAARSPQKSCHESARVLNRTVGSPFWDRIKVLGTAAPGSRMQLLTQAAFIDRLLPYLSTDPVSDRDDLKRGKGLQPTSVDAQRHLIFREMFRTERDGDVTATLWNYFAAVEEKWRIAWGENAPGKILNRTTGYSALMRFLQPAYLAFGSLGAVPTKAHFESVFAAVRLSDEDFTSERFKPGGSGEATLTRDLVEQSGVGRGAAGSSSS